MRVEYILFMCHHIKPCLLSNVMLLALTGLLMRRYDLKSIYGYVLLKPVCNDLSRCTQYLLYICKSFPVLSQIWSCKLITAIICFVFTQ